MNYCAKLNEYGQKKHVNVRYEETSNGQDHNKMFTARAIVNGRRFPVGIGKSKKEAKDNAALNAMGMLPHTDSSGFSALPGKITQTNYQSWLNEHGQKTRVTYRPVESTRAGSANVQFCCKYISDNNKSYPMAYGKSKQEAKEKAAKLAYEVLKTERNYCTIDHSHPSPSQDQKWTTSVECSPSCHPSRTSVASIAGGKHSGSSLTPAFPATVLSHSSHLEFSTSASGPVQAELNFFNKHKAELEERLSTPPVLSKLESCGILNAVERETVEAERISFSQNRALIVMLSKKGERAQEKFYEILKKTDPYLVEDLENP